MQPVAFLVVVLALLTGSANAQVLRCKDANGGIVYSDTVCGHAPQHVPPPPPRPAIDPREERARIEAARMLAAQQAAAQQAAAQQAAAQQAYVESRQCLSERDIKNMETSASSLTLKLGEFEFLQGEIARARACHPLHGDAGRQAAIAEAQAQAHRQAEAQREAEAARRRQEAAQSRPLNCYMHGNYLHCN